MPSQNCSPTTWLARNGIQGLHMSLRMYLFSRCPQFLDITEYLSVSPTVNGEFGRVVKALCLGRNNRSAVGMPAQVRTLQLAFDIFLFFPSPVWPGWALIAEISET